MRIKPSSFLSMFFCCFCMFNPQPVISAEKIKIYPIGDSITECWAYNSCWRYWLNKILLEKNMENIDFVGSKNGPVSGISDENNWDMDHDGHCSATTSDILNGGFIDDWPGNLYEWAPEFMADIVVIHLGTNDMPGGEPELIAGNFEIFIDVLRETNQNVQIVLCQIPHIWGKDFANRAVPDSIVRFNELLVSLKDSKTTPQSPIRIVNLDENWDSETDTEDGIHTSESGAVKIAERVFSAVESWVSINDSKRFSTKRNPSYSGQKEAGLFIHSNGHGLTGSVFTNYTSQTFPDRIYLANGQHAKFTFYNSRDAACLGKAYGVYVLPCIKKPGMN